MTTPTPPSEAPTTGTLHTTPDCVGHCVGTASEITPRAQRVDCVGPAPLPYGGRHSQRAPHTASATTASTASDTRTCRICGCTDFTPCIGLNDYACWWIEPNLCSACRGLD
jgi:hypothetical protein